MEKTGNTLGLSAPEADPVIRIQGQTFMAGGVEEVIPENTSWW